MSYEGKERIYREVEQTKYATDARKTSFARCNLLGKTSLGTNRWICLRLRRLFSERSESKATTVATITSLRIKASIPVRLNKVHQQSERVLGLSISFALSNPNFLLVDTTTYQSRTEYFSLSLFLYLLFVFVKKKICLWATKTTLNKLGGFQKQNKNLLSA